MYLIIINIITERKMKCIPCSFHPLQVDAYYYMGKGGVMISFSRYLHTICCFDCSTWIHFLNIYKWWWFGEFGYIVETFTKLRFQVNN